MINEYIFLNNYIHYEYYFNKRYDFKKGKVIKVRCSVLNNKNYYFFDDISIGLDDHDNFFKNVMLLTDFIEIRNSKIEKIIND